MAKILITGGTGLIGNKLTQLLIENNHEVVILSREPSKKNEFKFCCIHHNHNCEK
jgi:NAD dependent epimerase/dehydratase family enzyme